LKTSYVGGSGGKKANFAATVPVTLPIYRKIKTQFKNETKFVFFVFETTKFVFLFQHEWMDKKTFISGFNFNSIQQSLCFCICFWKINK
jgi:hypothetical protein